MPSLGKYEYNHQNAAGERFEFRAEMSVDSRGIFSIILSDDLAEVAARLGFSVTKPRTNWRLEHRDLEAAKRQVRQAVADMMMAEAITERVIVYSTDLRASFWQNPDGSISTNGYMGTSREEGGDWGTVGNLSATESTTHFQVGVFAKVFDRTEYRRPSGSKVVFSKPEMGNFRAEDPAMEWAHRLNSFNGLWIALDRLESLPCMPHTEAAAKFFHDTLIGLCLLSRQIDGFFKSPDALRIAIEKQQPLLSAPSR